MTEEFSRLVTQFETDLPGSTWLVMNNCDPGEDWGYFVNLRPPAGHYGFSSTSYGPSPESAFTKALFKVSQYLGQPHLKAVP